MHESQQRMEQLQGEVKTGTATEDTYKDMCNVETIIRERIVLYVGNPEKLFEWCENLETHLIIHDMNGKKSQMKQWKGYCSPASQDQLKKRRCSEIKPQLKVEIEDGREAP